MPKNIVICVDGTNNEFRANNTNVVKLFQSLAREDPLQSTYYTTGVGTFTVKPALTGLSKLVQKTLGLAFGLGLSQTLLDCYRFLMENYETGDRVFLFGFSRGAYTVRTLAGLIHHCGLLRANHVNLIPSTLQFYMQKSSKEVVTSFKETFSIDCGIHFLGIWDTVSSVGWVWDPVKLPHTTNNESVSVIRHAVSIDERRAFFRQNLWTPLDHQDVKEVWFAGVHSDVGGGYAIGDSGLSLLALEWMMVEARSHGLHIDFEGGQKVLSEGCTPDAQAAQHNSLTDPIFWVLAEFFPKLAYSRRFDRSLPRFNLFRKRTILSGITVHESVQERKKSDRYAPKNLPALTNVEARIRWEKEGDGDSVLG